MAAQDATTDRDPAVALGYCRTASGRPLVAAEVLWLPCDPIGIGWLDRRLPPPSPVRGHTDARGRFRLTVPSLPALCMVRSAAGLGALVTDASPGAPLQITAHPLGAVYAADGRLRAARFRLAEGGPTPRLLPPPSDAAERALPAGVWLVQLATPPRELRLVVEIGERTAIPPPADSEPGRAPPGLPPPPSGHRWIATGSTRWPVTLPGPAVEPLPSSWARPTAPVTLEALLRGPHGDRLWTTPWPPRAGVAPDAPAAGRWIEHRVLDPDGSPSDGAWLFAVRLTTAGDVQLLSCSRTDPDGRARALVEAPDLDPREVRVAAWRSGLPLQVAPGAVRRADSEAQPVHLSRGTTAKVRILDADGLPLAHTTLTLVDPDHPVLLRRQRRSDARGLVVLHDLPADEPLDGLATHPDHLPARFRLRPGATEETVVQLAAGLSVQGRVFESDGHPAREVGVELRDSAAPADTPPRRTVTGPDGSFRFQGLPEGLFTLFTIRQAGGTTWSGIRRGVQSGTGNEWRLELRSEDPVPPGPDRKDGQ